MILEILASRVEKALRFTVIPRALMLFLFPSFHFHRIVSNVANCKIKLKTKKNCSEVNFKESEEIIIAKEILLSFGICS